MPKFPYSYKHIVIQEDPKHVFMTSHLVGVTFQLGDLRGLRGPSASREYTKGPDGADGLKIVSLAAAGPVASVR